MQQWFVETWSNTIAWMFEKPSLTKRKRKEIKEDLKTKGWNIKSSNEL